MVSTRHPRRLPIGGLCAKWSQGNFSVKKQTDRNPLPWELSPRMGTETHASICETGSQQRTQTPPGKQASKETGAGDARNVCYGLRASTCGPPVPEGWHRHWRCRRCLVAEREGGWGTGHKRTVPLGSARIRVEGRDRGCRKSSQKRWERTPGATPELSNKLQHTLQLLRRYYHRYIIYYNII